jgi:hypothetical protein
MLQECNRGCLPGIRDRHAAGAMAVRPLPSGTHSDSGSAPPSRRPPSCVTPTPTTHIHRAPSESPGECLTIPSDTRAPPGCPRSVGSRSLPPLPWRAFATGSSAALQARIEQTSSPTGASAAHPSLNEPVGGPSRSATQGRQNPLSKKRHRIGLTAPGVQGEYPGLSEP